MDNPTLQKTIIIIILVLWVIDVFRTKKKRTDPAIEEADARERHEWRYLRWGFWAVHVAATVYIFVQLIQFLLA